MEHQLHTENGYDFYEVASALQKSIRRGIEEDAVFWAFELDSLFPDFLWKRLTVIANEDVGLADPSVIVLVESLRQAVQAVKQNPVDRRLLATNAVIAMCRAKKTRLGDSMASVIHRRRVMENLRLDIPDYALDQHTRRGSMMGRSWDFWEREGCQLANEAEGMDTYFSTAMELRRKHGKLPKQRERRRAAKEPNLFDD